MSINTFVGSSSETFVNSLTYGTVGTYLRYGRELASIVSYRQLICLLCETEWASATGRAQKLDGSRAAGGTTPAPREVTTAYKSQRSVDTPKCATSG